MATRKGRTRRLGGNSLFAEEETGGALLADVHGAGVPAPAPVEAKPVAAVPVRAELTPMAPAGRVAMEVAIPAVERRRATMTTTFRIYQEHADALHDEAWRRARIKGLGKADSSEVLREILDAWVKAQR